MGQWVTNKIFNVHFLIVSVSYEEKISKKINLKKLIGSVVYKLVLGPIPILHTNFQENLLTILGISRHFKIIKLILIGSESPTSFPFILSLSASVSYKENKIQKNKKIKI